MLSSIKYPIKILCILQNKSDSVKDIEQVQEHASNIGLDVSIREYNSLKYSDDRNYIEQLPAFHVYVSGGYRMTMYPDERPLDHIDNFVREYEINRAKIKRFAKAWSYLKNVFNAPNIMIKNHGQKK